MRGWCLIAVTAGVLLASPCWAQKPHDDAATSEARQRYNEGLKFAEESNHEAARLKFSQAWMLLKSPVILFNLARSEQLSGHSVEALEHFRQFAKLPADPKITGDQRERAKELIAELTAKVGQLDIDAAPNSKIAIDGKSVEWPQADPIVVSPGAHEVTATLDGKPTTVTVDAAAGAVTKAKLRAETAPEAAPLPPSTPKPVATAPPPEAPSSAWSAGRVAGLAIAGGGLVAVGLGFYFHIDSSNAGDDADAKSLGRSGCRDSLGAAKPAECATLADLRDHQDRSAFLRNGMWLGGGALVVGGAALFLLSGTSKEKPTAWHVLPAVTPKSSGLAVVGAF